MAALLRLLLLLLARGCINGGLAGGRGREEAPQDGHHGEPREWRIHLQKLGGRSAGVHDVRHYRHLKQQQLEGKSEISGVGEVADAVESLGFFERSAHHGGGDGGAGHQAGLGEPAAAPGGDGVGGGDGERPEEEDLHPYEAEEEGGALEDKVVAELCGVPAPEIGERLRDEVRREAELGVHQRHAHREDEEEGEQHRHVHRLP